MSDNMTVRVHWLTLVIHTTLDVVETLIYEEISKIFGPLVDKEQGGRFYKRRKENAAGIKIYYEPYVPSLLGDSHCCIDIPGSACDCISPEIFTRIMDIVDGLYYPYRVTRLDLAFDQLDFSPADVRQAFVENKLVSLVKRNKMRWIESGEKKDTGEDGTTTFEAGSNKSDRMITVYDKRGYTRLEFQCRNERASLVALDVLKRHYSAWYMAAAGHLRQYIDFLTPWWVSFVEGYQRFSIKISSARNMSIKKMRVWLGTQVSMALYVLDQLSGEILRDDLIEEGRKRYEQVSKKRVTRYDTYMQMV